MAKYQLQLNHTPQFVTIQQYHIIAVHCMYNLPAPTKVAAIRMIKDAYNLGLKEAKDVCDWIAENVTITEAKSEIVIKYRNPVRFVQMFNT